MRLALALISSLMLSGCSSEPTGIVPNQWSVINYWAIWCKPCRDEIPELNLLNQIENVVVLGVNFDGKVDEALFSDVSNLGIAFDIIDDPASNLNIASVHSHLVCHPRASSSRHWWDRDRGINHGVHRPG